MTVGSSELGGRGEMETKRYSAYSFVLILAMFVLFALSSGIAYSFGLYHLIFLEVFQKGSTITAWISSINMGMQGFVAPVASLLSDRIGLKWTAMVGGFLSFVGLLVTAFAPNIHVVFFSIGILTGIGFGIVYTMGTVVIALHFDRWRPIALAIAQSGLNVGSFVYPIFGEWILGVYGWRGTMLVTSALTLNMVAAGAVIREKLPTQAEKSADDAESKPTQSGRRQMWTNWKYWLCHVLCFFMYFALISFTTHIASYAQYLGHSDSNTVMLISIQALSGFICRNGLSFVASLQRTDIYWLLFVTTLVPGLCHFMVTFSDSFVMLCVSTMLHSIIYGTIGPVFIEVICLILGAEDFALGYGCLEVSMAVGALLGPPASGFAYEGSGSYETSFYVTGTSLIIAAFCTIPLALNRNTQSTVISESETKEVNNV